MPLPGRSGMTASPSTICSGSCTTLSAQSTYSRKCAVGVTASRCALVSEYRCDDILILRLAANAAACCHPVTPPMRSRSGITRSQALALSAVCIPATSEKFSPICTGTESSRAISAAPA